MKRTKVKTEKKIDPEVILEPLKVEINHDLAKARAGTFDRKALQQKMARALNLGVFIQNQNHQ